ncbi:phosphoribosylanthranilate isomerase [Thermodesulfobacterium thermophilum]|uniref:phosphoribosylanthranilate isomerase n=1 Tax=Thermodesulfobacterium thermophilum TaxID=886 RepID=UPI0003B624A1|nr:phosphoribosylanthranilate isomerase [Thermodesulfobacterium thermophilum]
MGLKTKIKICGLTRKEDLLFLNRFPVDYLGFVLYPRSPRYVGENLKHLLGYVREGIQKVAVLVNPTYEEVKAVLDTGIDLIQLHGEETVEFAKKIGLSRVIKAFRIKDKVELDLVAPWEKAYAILTDTFVKGVPGGTGKTFNWSLAKVLVDHGYKVFLAGGLTPENVKQAISTIGPYGIDLSSGVEVSPGIKDSTKISNLFKQLEV